MAREVLDHADLTRYFTVIAGASDDEERSTKADVVAEALRRLQELGIDTSTLGHGRRPRLRHARRRARNGVPTILVEWGYGSPAEAGDAMAVVHSADQLRNLLLG